MAQCPNCHNEVKAEERFCGNCGARLEQRTQPPADSAAADSPPARPTGKETVVLPKITDLGMTPPTPPASGTPASDATIVAAPAPTLPPPATPTPSDATFIGATPELPPGPPTQPTPPPVGGGAYTGASLPEPPVMAPPPKSGGGVWKVLAIIAGIGVLACVALAIGAYLFFQRVSREVGNTSGSVFATVSAGLETAAAMPSLEPLATIEAAIATPKPGATAAAGPTTTANGAGAVLLRDNFDDPQSSDFTEDENDSAIYKFIDGTYAITVKKAKLLSWATMNGNYTDASIAVEANIDSSKTSAAGLIFHYQDDKNFYIYSVDGEGRYALDVYKDDKLTTLIDWTESSAINAAGETNKLRVETNGDTIRLYANDKLLDEISDSTISRGKAALVVNTFDDPNVTVKFDNLVVQGVK